MKSIEEIRQQLESAEFEFSRHAFKRAVERNISRQEIQEAGKNADIIEVYPDDKYSPSCLLLGVTSAERPLHLQVSLSNSDKTKIITLYEPDAQEWINYSIRR